MQLPVHGRAYMSSVADIAVPWSAVDDGHVPFVMALTGGRRQVVQPFDLLATQLDAVGRCVLLNASDPLGAGNRGDVVALREQPGQSDLCWCCSRT